MNNPIFGRAVLVSGPESLLAERAVVRLERAALAERPDATPIHLSALGLDGGTLTEAVGGSLLSESAFVVISDAADLPHDLFDLVGGIAADPGPDSALVVVHPGGVKGKGLVDRLKKAKVEIIECPAIKPWELARFAASEVRVAGGSIDSDTAERLTQALGGDARAVAAAVRQLISDTEDGIITQQVVNRYFVGRADVTSFAVADHVMAGRRTEALGALRWALDTVVPPVLITSALAGSLRSLGKYFEHQDSRMRGADLARAVGVPPWKIKDLARQSSQWQPAAVARAIVRTARADAAVKGAESDPAFALEQLVLFVTGLQGRRPN